MNDRTYVVWKGYKYKYNPTDSGQCCVVLVHLATLCWLSLGFAEARLCWWCCVILVHLAIDHSLMWLCRVKHTKEIVVFWHFLPLLQSWTNWQSLVVSSGSNCHCWFVNSVCEWIELLLMIGVNWTADILTMQIGFIPKELFLSRSTSSFALLSSPFHHLWWVVG